MMHEHNILLIVSLGRKKEESHGLQFKFELNQFPPIENLSQDNYVESITCI